jgi:anaerobic magnesium-protoporphyrin IX monomethyl ester cyclase
MAKILLINPVIRQDDHPKHVPYGLALIAAILERDGHQFQILDANAHRPADRVIVEVLRADDWDVVATGGISTVYGYVKKVLRLAQRHAPRSLRMVGGGLVTSMPVDLMRLLPEIDIGVVGEAFETLPEILTRLDSGHRDWDAVKGIIWRTPAGHARLTPQRPLYADIDRLPYPAWQYFPLDIYFKNSALLYSEEAFSAKRRLDINASYGCPFICRFCFHLGTAGDMQYVPAASGLDQEVLFTHDRVHRWHSARYVVEMVKYVRDTYGVDFVLFLDENLIAMDSASRHRWLPELCRLWIAEGLQPECVRQRVPHDPDRCHGVHWGATSHAALVQPETLEVMRDAGCAQLLYGLESFSVRVLKNVGKGSTPELNERALRITLDAGIRPIPNQMMGFPDEFFDSLIDCVEAWDRLGIQVKPFFATPYPGTEWFNRYRDRILAQYDGDLDAFMEDLGDATEITGNICDNFTDVELYGLRELMVRRDIGRIRRYEARWRALHHEPRFEDVRWPRAKRIQKSPTPVAPGRPQ